MFLYLLNLLLALDVLRAVYLNDYQDITHKNYMPNEEVEFEPVTVLTKEKEKYVSSKSINCDDFSRFALNCTVEAAFIYNSTRISPPLPEKIGVWCKVYVNSLIVCVSDGAVPLNGILRTHTLNTYPDWYTTTKGGVRSAIKHLVNCAIDWNADCKDVTQEHFNEEGIKGHIHVIQSICDDEWFLTQYLDLSTCVENKATYWENCYLIFKKLVEQEKNTTHEWTHYDTHFNLCCARAEFRRCTLETIFRLPTKCSYENAVTLQKFSVIISEGAVYQDCDRNMMYSNCPGGDPRPSRRMLTKLMSSEAFNKACLLNANLWTVTLFLVTVW